MALSKQTGKKGIPTLNKQRTLVVNNNQMEVDVNRKRGHQNSPSPPLTQDDKLSKTAKSSPLPKKPCPHEDPLMSPKDTNSEKRVSGENNLEPGKIGAGEGHTVKNGNQDQQGEIAEQIKSLFAGLTMQIEGKIELGFKRAQEKLSENFDQRLENMGEKVAGRLERINSRVSKVEREAGDIREEVNQLSVRTERIEKAEVDMEIGGGPLRENTNLRIDRMEFDLLRSLARSNFLNLLIDGIPETLTVDNTMESVTDFCQKILGVSDIALSDAKRMGARPRVDKTPRTVFVTCATKGNRDKIWSAKGKLKDPVNSKYRIREDTPPELKDINSLFLQIAYVAKQDKNHFTTAAVSNFVLYLNRSPYYPWEIKHLPNQLQPAVVCSPRDEGTIVFFTKYSPLSNHHASRFPLDQEWFDWVEQYLALKKAILANDQTAMVRARQAKTAAECKAVLNSLHGPHLEAQWKSQIPEMLNEALGAKFRANKDLRDFLIDTYPRVIGEASTNKTWGIGISLYSSHRLNRAKWTGENKLGLALQAVREQIRDEEEANVRHKEDHNRRYPDGSNGTFIGDTLCFNPDDIQEGH